MDDPDSDEEMKESKVAVEEGPDPFAPSASSVYDLHSTITHLGSSVHGGHYVCNVKMDDRWVYFNDDKVAETNNPPLGKGYMYFLKQK